MLVQHKRITNQDRIDAVIHCTGFFVDAMNGTANDKQDAIKLALKTYDAGASAASAIYHGYNLIRKRHYTNQCLIAIMKTWNTVQ